ncbi:efflux transporter, outer membrane factor (OMF) lipoprotein, NodT family [Cnuella takakiae]|uniref:Efflux transporter, outer membrane factor (OMF) lipoprotein, NodT family n=2 Tax=Cnuella takakiae TaxID=1302690 RepID=A0A1M5CIZ5_9BACT|nr:efflux transporter, outer membrane factor (OMF) lipoprotein, NodT family [Cnuella takakiae]
MILLVSWMLAACKVTRPYTGPQTDTNGLYRDGSGADTNTIANLPYTAVFTDTVLQRLIAEGITQNLDLRVAYTRIQQSQAYYTQARAAFLPTLSANAGVTESKLSDVQGFGIRTSLSQFQLGVASSWEADVWGRLRSNRRASLAALLQTEAAARAVQTGIVSTIASYYYTLLALDQQLVITRETVRNWDSTVAVLRALKEAASVTEAAVVQSEAQRYAAEVTIPDLKQNIRETEHALSILLARPPGPIERSSLEGQQALALLQTGVPAQLLANRPDVQQAEFAYRNAFELTNVARTAFYPALAITGSAGLNSLSLAQFIDPSALAASIGVGLTQPIFNRRLNRTNLAVAQAGQQAALYDFRKALLNAGREVSDALSLHATALEKMSVRTNQLSALEKSVAYTQELLQYGFANYNEVIIARQSLLGAQLGGVNDRLQQLQATVNLYRSLGGGWK